MLKSLYINNYRNLKELKINSLGNINLITGKNNTGKSSILEAIAIYASGANMQIVNELLKERGESLKSSVNNKNYISNNIKAISSLFNDRKIGFDVKDAISIGSVEETLFGDENISEQRVSLRFIQYLDEITRDNIGNISTRKRTIVDFDQKLDNLKIGIEIRNGSKSYIQSIEDERIRFSNSLFDNNDNFEFIRTRNIDRDINSKLWDDITLTEKEQYVIDALKIIEPFAERIAFIEENTRERTAVIKLSNSSSIIPLRSMGDGINRILTIILALVNTDNGFLLIDEFENGLHYTVQEKLWNIVFVLANKLGVQVLATTHSEDCILAFERELNKKGNNFDGKLIRLDNDNGIIKQVEFSARELKIANDNDIEIR
jgi:AAA15 family ATPase/GTPase